MKTRLAAVTAIAFLSGCSLFKVDGLSARSGSGSAGPTPAAADAPAEPRWLSETTTAFDKWYGGLSPLVAAQQAALDKVLASSEGVYEKEAAIEKIWAKTREAPQAEQVDAMYFLQYPVIVAVRKIHASAGGSIATSRFLSKLGFRTGYEQWCRALGAKDMERDMFIYAAEKGELRHLGLSSVDETDSFPLPSARAEAAKKTWNAAKEDDVNLWPKAPRTEPLFQATDVNQSISWSSKGRGDKDFTEGESNYRVTRVEKGSITLSGFYRHDVAFGCKSMLGTEGGQMAMVPVCNHRQEDTKYEVVVGISDLPAVGVSVGDMIDVVGVFKGRAPDKKKTSLKVADGYLLRIERDGKAIFER